MAQRAYTLDEFRRYLGELPEHLHQAAVRGLRTGGQRCVPILQRAADTARPASPNGRVGARSTGAYRGAFRSSPIADGVLMHNMKAYADVIEGGRRPGKFPPVKVIERWARLRLGLSAKEAKRAAYPIARAIARRGLQPRHVLWGAHRQMVAVMVEEVRRSVGEALHARRGR